MPREGVPPNGPWSVQIYNVHGQWSSTIGGGLYKWRCFLLPLEDAMEAAVLIRDGFPDFTFRIFNFETHDVIMAAVL